VNGTLFKAPSPPIPGGVDLRVADVAEVLPTVSGARLVIADPPWSYHLGEGASLPSDHYGCLSTETIAAHVRAAAASALPGARLALWTTGPLLAEWMRQDVRPWRYVSAGAWTKGDQHVGQGYHWRSGAELVLLYALPGRAGRPSCVVRSGHTEAPTLHSYKPIGWQREWIRGWTDPGDLVLDLYCGLGSVAAASVLEGRRYVGAEVDPGRARDALALVALEARRLSWR
jgi:hypothetical protein